MTSRILLLGSAALLSTAIYAGSAFAFTENEIVRFHEACAAGDRAACAHRDAVIHDREHETEWRHSHPEWYR
jgi:hypothetical protein